MTRRAGIRSAVAVAAIAGCALLLMAGPASASVGKGMLFHDGDTIRTVVVSSPVPGGGTDPLYEVTNGAEGQLGVAGVATFNDGVTPYLLTSDEAVFAAEAAGDVTVTRDAAADFRCPVQP